MVVVQYVTYQPNFPTELLVEVYFDMLSTKQYNIYNKIPQHVMN